MPGQNPSSPRILLTGGRGSLAAVIAEELRTRTARVETYSRTAGAGHEELGSLLRDRALEDATAVMHLAWSTVPFSAEQTPGFENTHDLPLLQQLLDRLAAIPTTRRPHFIFFSSGGTVYGNARQGQAHREGDPCDPIGHHGRAKLAAEGLIQQHAAKSGIPWTILRISNPYGFPVPSGRQQGIIPAAIKSAREGRTMTLWGDGSARKDFLHYSDFARAIAAVAEKRPSGVYNVGSGESHTILEVLGLVESATGRRIPIVHAPPYRWDVHDSLLDVSKLRSALGWSPTVSLREGIERMVATQIAV